MVHEAEQGGRCPHCEEEGAIGVACPNPLCSKRGYHYVPAFFLQLQESDTALDLDPLVGQKMDDYLLATRIGSGGFGRVYLAFQIPIMLKTALKILTMEKIPANRQSVVIRKFKGEASALATLTHPNIVRLLKYGTHSGRPFLVMEYVEGARNLKMELFERVLNKASMPIALVDHIIGQTLNALEAAHRQGIIHRDIKPENIMIQRVLDDNYFVKLLDFGLAKFVENHTETSSVMGTPVYMAPEQIVQKNLGPWTDLYSVAVVAYELMTGRCPFPGEDHREIMARKVDPDFDPTARIADMGLPDEVMAFFSRALYIAPDERFRSVDEFKEGFATAVQSLQDAPETIFAETEMGELVAQEQAASVASQQEVLARERKSIEEERKRLRLEQAQLQEERERIERDSVGPTVPGRRLTPTRSTVLKNRAGASIITETGLFEPAGKRQVISLVALALLVVLFAWWRERKAESTQRPTQGTVDIYEAGDAESVEPLVELAVTRLDELAVWKPGNIWILNVERRPGGGVDDEGAPLEYRVRRIITNVEQIEGGVRVYLTETGGLLPPRRRIYRVGEKCIELESAAHRAASSREKTRWCRTSDWAVGTVLNRQIHQFTAQHSVHRVSFSAELGWVRELRTQDRYRRNIRRSLVSYRIGDRTLGDVDAVPHPCLWDAKSANALEPDEESGTVEIGLSGKHGVRNGRLQISKGKTRLELDDFPDPSVEGGVELPSGFTVAKTWLAPDGSAEYVVLLFESEEWFRVWLGRLSDGELTPSAMSYPKPPVAEGQAAAPKANLNVVLVSDGGTCQFQVQRRLGRAGEHGTRVRRFQVTPTGLAPGWGSLEGESF